MIHHSTPLAIDDYELTKEESGKRGNTHEVLAR